MMLEPAAGARVPPRLVRLADTALLIIEGPEALPFLQGQVTCDVQALTEGQVTLGAICNPKGRAITSFRMVRGHGQYWLILSSDLIDAVKSILQRYVLRAKVTLRDARSEWSILGLLGDIDERAAAALGVSASPSVGCSVVSARRTRVVAVDRAQKYLILAPAAVAAAIETALHNEGLTVDAALSAWQRAEIGDGVPLMSPATAEEFVPQMLNLDLLGGIGFAKGCYTGQEVIARAHYLGTVKRRMHRFQVCSDRVPEPGTRLIHERDEQPAGQVISAVAVADDCYELLAVVANDCVQQGPVRLWSSSGPKLERLALPYLDAELARADSST